MTFELFMNSIKKIAGVIWILLGPLDVYYLIKTAAAEIAKKPVIDTKSDQTTEFCAIAQT